MQKSNSRRNRSQAYEALCMKERENVLELKELVSRQNKTAEEQQSLLQEKDIKGQPIPTRAI
ncbi:hypothetical protein C5167_050503 [Papaver somniferum]|uniref:Uncharacterized protein n=1 Tax=Papaver somniferum TaxID=3469 RepID=A0A4Y7KQ88_PAPSO|nr:hypothetical protein C5167_050503 [Papaver somniferum]